MRTAFLDNSCMAFRAGLYFLHLLDVIGVNHVCSLPVSHGVVALRVLEQAGQWLAGLAYRCVGNLLEDGRGVFGLG
jgi:hypothetical protein